MDKHFDEIDAQAEREADALKRSNHVVRPMTGRSRLKPMSANPQVIHHRQWTDKEWEAILNRAIEQEYIQL